MGASKPCCICLGDSGALGAAGGKGTKGSGGGSGTRTIQCSSCPRVTCFTCLSRNVGKSRLPPSPAKGAGGAGAGGAAVVDGWRCPVCDPRCMASADEMSVAARRRGAWTKASEAGGWKVR